MLRVRTPARPLPMAVAFSVVHPQLAPLVLGIDTAYSQSTPAVSSTPIADQTCAPGKIIRVTLTSGEGAEVSGAQRLQTDMNLPHWDEQLANYETGGRTASLTFVHEGVEPNTSTQALAALANAPKLNGGAVRSASSGGDADLSDGGSGVATVIWGLKGNDQP